MARAASDRAVGTAEARGLFAPLEEHALVALAVSGGRDSMALLRLAQRWAGEGGRRPSLVALTVDHGLRRGSAKEAARVGAWCADLNIHHHILTWTGAKPRTRVEERAREVRYDLLTAWCRDHGASALALAHHLDDQAETVLMRLARSSGLDGLAGMAPASRRGEVAILRPLLGVPRARLAATLKDLGQDWIEDPSNQDAGVERVRLRAAADQLAALGLDASAVAGSARKLARAAGALAEIAAGHGRACVRLEPAGFALIDRAGFLVAPEEIRLRVLRDVLVRVGGGAAPRDGALERAVGELTAEEPAALALARCRVLAHGRRSWLVVRELRDQRPVRLRGGESVVWDGRFAVTLGAGLVEGAIDLRPLGEPAFGSLRRRAGHLAAVPQLAGAALPGGFDGEALVLAPVFGREEGLNVRFLGMEPAGAANSPSS